MPERCTRKRGPEVARRAAAVYLEGGIAINDVLSRFGIGRTTLATAVAKLRQERANAVESSPGRPPEGAA